MQPDHITEAIERAMTRLAPGARQAEVDRLRTELAGVGRTIDRLTSAIADGGELSALVARLKLEEQRKVDLEAQLATAEHLVANVDVVAIRATLERRLDEWRATLQAQVTQARQILRKVLDGPVVLTPAPDGVRLEGQASYGKVLEGLVPSPPKCGVPRGRRRDVRRQNGRLVRGVGARHVVHDGAHHVKLNAMPCGRGRDPVRQIALSDVNPTDVLAALQHAVHPRTCESPERFTPLVGLPKFRQAFTGDRFRFRCGIGAAVKLPFDVDGEVSASASGGTTIRMSIRLALAWRTARRSGRRSRAETSVLALPRCSFE